MNNDLISREALKKVFLSYDYLNMGLYTMSMSDIIKLIDNAPTVKAFTEEDMTGAYNEGYMCGNKEAEKGRPQGEWIENNYGKIQCSICKGFAISTMTGCLMDRHLEQYKTKFCPNCGADMQKGGAE